ncbi:MAG: hypothetical protein K940chlam9_00158 [Chlamydiae bacterium]|nr:hypothetical protein [Chlamydiota bacterium]
MQSDFHRPLDTVTQLQHLGPGKHHAHVPSQNIRAIRLEVEYKSLADEVDLDLSLFPKVLQNDRFFKTALNSIDSIGNKGNGFSRPAD